MDVTTGDFSTLDTERDTVIVNDSSPTKIQHSLILPLTLLVAVTCITNIIIMACTRVERRLRRSPTNLYVFSLALVDTVVGVVVMAGMLVYTVYGYWPLGDLACTAWVNTDFSCCTISMLHLCLIAHDRYQALVHPLQYKRPNRGRCIFLQITWAWAVGFLAWVPAILAFRLTMEPVQDDCLFVPDKIYVVVQSVVIYYIPILVMIYFYIMCLMGLRRQYTKIQAMRAGNLSMEFATMHCEELEKSMYDATTVCVPTVSSRVSGEEQNVHTSATTPTTSTTTKDCASVKVKNMPVLRQATRRRREHLRSIRTLGLVMATFLFCWLPFCVLWPAVAFCESCIPPRVYEYSYWAAYLNSAINPCLYFLANKDFRTAFKTLLRWTGCYKARVIKHREGDKD